MTEELTATMPDTEMAKLEAMAVQHDTDAAQELSAQPPAPAQPEAEQTEVQSEVNPDNSETDPEKAKERPRDALGRFTKTEAGEDIPEADRKPVEAPAAATLPTVSEFEAKKQEKARKEQERLDKTWKNVDLRKDELERRERDLAQREQQMRQQPQPQRQRMTTEDGQPITSQGLASAARDFKARAKKALETGDYDAFNENEALAEQSMAHAQQFYEVEQREAQAQQQQQYQEFWNTKMKEVFKEEPDLIKPESALSQGMSKLLQEHGQFLYGMPEGFRYGVEYVKNQIAAGSVSELRDKLTKAEAEVQRLTKATTPLGAGPTAPIQNRKLDDLTTDEQMKELERMAARADAEAAAA